ncbi:MAG: RNA-binding transcriptional accessory protein [Candidatus Omnitrophica bacterium]|nr:RNA-binding transcriptional accessory protein [Candidatus Omnitrophota bacterium]
MKNLEQLFDQKIAAELGLSVHQVEGTLKLLDSGATVPFIARYRKEATGSLDEVKIIEIRDRALQLKELEKRRAAILASIEEQGKLTPELSAKVKQAETMAKLEDLYLPYKPKRRTRATVAREKGLEPLADLIFQQKGIDPAEEAKKFINAESGVETVEDALSGARDIIAEWINEYAETRERLRDLYQRKGIISSKILKGKEEEGAKFKDYFDWSQPVDKAPSHRILAARRGEKENILTVHIAPPEDLALSILRKQFLKGKGADAEQVELALVDSYKRLLSVSLETETRLFYKKKADQEAIDIFKDNLQQLLMAPPLGQKNILAIDPGFRTGCKVVCLDKHGQLVANETVYLIGSKEKTEKTGELIQALCEKYKIEYIAIGNGTASRETEAFVKGLNLDKAIRVVMVSESGASVYSASEVARDEFPNEDVTVRGAISIGRRLMDPLAELVKIEPKSIGVGQYQHDVDQKLLKNSLDDVVIQCVNQVGVEVNTASKQLLTYVSGLGPSRAQAMIDYRTEHNGFKSRKDFLKVAGLGAKAIEQAAGFLRIVGGKNPLDASAVHPESYPVVEQMAADLACSIEELTRQEALQQKIDLKKYVTENIGMPTLVDIQTELSKPGRDPREPFELFQYQEGIHTIDDLKPGMKLPGVITNITAFGVFVDIGVHQDGLVHVSQLSDKYVKDPRDVVRLHQKVTVTVLEIDKKRGRIALSCKK